MNNVAKGHQSGRHNFSHFRMVGVLESDVLRANWKSFDHYLRVMRILLTQTANPEMYMTICSPQTTRKRKRYSPSWRRHFSNRIISSDDFTSVTFSIAVDMKELYWEPVEVRGNIFRPFEFSTICKVTSALSNHESGSRPPICLYFAAFCFRCRQWLCEHL